MPIETTNGKKSVPEGLWTKCPKCEQIIYNKELEENFKICPKCGGYFRLSARERVGMLCDARSFQELDPHLAPANPLNFKDLQSYKDRLNEAQKKTGLTEAVLCGQSKIDGHDVLLAVLDFDFMGGSMGSVVGEKVTRAIEAAHKKRLPLVLMSSSGGARMQEGILSLMQMAKTAAALAQLHEAGLPFISVMTDPTTGGVTASFAMLGDINLAEPKALIAFAGPRVIEQTIRQQLPEGFQYSEFLLQHGMLDLIVERPKLKKTLSQILDFFSDDVRHDRPAAQ